MPALHQETQTELNLKGYRIQRKKNGCYIEATKEGIADCICITHWFVDYRFEASSLQFD